MPSDRPGIAPPLPASGRPTQPRLALARCRRRTRHPAKSVRAMVRGFARKPSRGRYRRSIAGDRRSRPRRTDRHCATARLRARLRRYRCLTRRSRLCTDHIRPAGDPPSRPTSIGAAGRLQSEWVADFNRNARPTSPEYATLVTENFQNRMEIHTENPAANGCEGVEKGDGGRCVSRHRRARSSVRLISC